MPPKRTTKFTAIVHDSLASNAISSLSTASTSDQQLTSTTYNDLGSAFEQGYCSIDSEIIDGNGYDIPSTSNTREPLEETSAASTSLQCTTQMFKKRKTALKSNKKSLASAENSSRLPPQTAPQKSATVDPVKKMLSKRRKLKYQLSKKKGSKAWLSFWSDDEKERLFEAVTKHGTAASISVLHKEIADLGKTEKDVREFVDSLRRDATAIALSDGFQAEFQLATSQVLACKEPFIRALGIVNRKAVRSNVVPLLAKAFIKTTDSNDPYNPEVDHSIDWDRICHTVASALYESSTTDSLRNMCSEYDLIAIKYLLQKVEAVAKRNRDWNTNLFQTLKDRLKVTGRGPAPKFSTQLPDGPFGQAALDVGCIADLNHLRIPAKDLIVSEELTDWVVSEIEADMILA